VACARSGAAWLEVAERHGDFALVGVAANLALDGRGRCTAVRLGYAGVGGTPVAAPDAAAVLEDEEPTAEAVAAAAERAARDCEPLSDGHGSASYRRRLVRVLTERALLLAVDRTGIAA
jgi:carbon-monoxide dehydrogenase medium subunit